MALAALGLTEAPVHEPVHDHHNERPMSTTERYHAPREIRLRSALVAAPAGLVGDGAHKESSAHADMGDIGLIALEAPSMPGCS